MRKQSRFSNRSEAPRGKADSRGPARPARGSVKAAHASVKPSRTGAARGEDRPSRDMKAAPRRDEGNFSENDKRGSGHRPRVDIPKDIRIVIGNHAIHEAVATHPKACRELWLREGWESSQDLKKIQSELRARGVHAVTKPDSVLDRFSGSHQGAALFMSYTPVIDWAALAEAPEASLLVLDGIEDPHNLGAILRTSWLMGVKGLLIPEDRAVGLTATVHKVACGGVEHVPVLECASFTNPVEELKKQGFWVFGLSHEGKKTIFDLRIPEKVVWCIGSEEKGLRSTTERLCDELVSIPQTSAAASYNASVATAIALTETLRQRRSQAEKNSSNL